MRSIPTCCVVWASYIWLLSTFISILPIGVSTCLESLGDGIGDGICVENASVGLDEAAVGAFERCRVIVTVVIADTVEQICPYMFFASTLQTVDLPDSIRVISVYAFGGNLQLSHIDVGNSITYIGPGGFYYCISLTTIVLPDSLTDMSYDTFTYCRRLTGITLSSSLRAIGNSTFADCTALQSITIPNAVTSIGSQAFFNCTSLQSVSLPWNVTILDNAFDLWGCHQQLSEVAPGTEVCSCSACTTTIAPTFLPTIVPSHRPTDIPTTMMPSITPTDAPISSAPSPLPSNAPSPLPTTTVAPSHNPTDSPTRTPSARPSATPSVIPTTPPTTISPSQLPTAVPSHLPSSESPTTISPSQLPTAVPSRLPSSESPTTISPSQLSTTTPSHVSTTTTPTSATPSAVPITATPTMAPSPSPTTAPSHMPSSATPTSPIPTTQEPAAATIPAPTSSIPVSSSPSHSPSSLAPTTTNPSAGTTSAPLLTEVLITTSFEQLSTSTMLQTTPMGRGTTVPPTPTPSQSESPTSTPTQPPTAMPTRAPTHIAPTMSLTSAQAPTETPTRAPAPPTMVVVIATTLPRESLTVPTGIPTTLSPIPTDVAVVGIGSDSTTNSGNTSYVFAIIGVLCGGLLILLLIAAVVKVHKNRRRATTSAENRAQNLMLATLSMTENPLFSTTLHRGSTGGDMSTGVDKTATSLGPMLWRSESSTDFSGTDARRWKNADAVRDAEAKTADSRRNSKTSTSSTASYLKFQDSHVVATENNTDTLWTKPAYQKFRDPHEPSGADQQGQDADMARFEGSGVAHNKIPDTRTSTSPNRPPQEPLNKQAMSPQYAAITEFVFDDSTVNATDRGDTAEDHPYLEPNTPVASRLTSVLASDSAGYLLPNDATVEAFTAALDRSGYLMPRATLAGRSSSGVEYQSPSEHFADRDIIKDSRGYLVPAGTLERPARARVGADYQQPSEIFVNNGTGVSRNESAYLEPIRTEPTYRQFLGVPDGAAATALGQAQSHTSSTDDGTEEYLDAGDGASDCYIHVQGTEDLSA